MEEWKESMRNAYSRKSEKDVINEVLKIKAILDDDDKSRHSWALFNKLLPLQFMGLSSHVLHTTGIASSVFRFRNHHHKPVKNLVTTILEQWRSDLSPVVADAMENKKHINPLPSTQKNRPLVRILYRKVQVNSDKENMITMDPNIPLQEVKSMGVADQERTIQINSRIAKGPAKLCEGEVNLKRKPLNLINKKKLDKSSVEEKVEATKRKLYESYKEAEDAKKRRRIQVIEFPELGKQGLLPKAGGQMKPRNALIKKLRSNGRCRKTIRF